MRARRFSAAAQRLIPGGNTIGLTLQTDGVAVVEFSGAAPGRAGLKQGDVITKINGRPVADAAQVGAAVQAFVEAQGFGVVRRYVGHGVGRQLHEAPEVPNYKVPGRRPDPRLVKGMTLAIEPMVTYGDYAIKVLANGWTVVTVDGSLAAHYENSVLITDGEPEILTMAEDI